MADQRKQTRTLMTDELGNGWAITVWSDGHLEAEPAKVEDYGTITLAHDDGGVNLGGRISVKAEPDNAQ